MDWKIVAAAILSWVQLKAVDKNTYLGIITIAASIGVSLSPELAQALVTGAGLLAGFILIGWKNKPTTEIVNVTVAASSTLPSSEKQILKG